MADTVPIADPGTCDTHDRGVTAERMQVLQNEAHAFNNLLSLTDNGKTGPAHKAAVQEANKEFYAFLPGAHNLDSGSYEASQAFFDQVTELPIGERRKLLQLTKAENQALHANNPKMPELLINMDSDAFINSLEFRLSNEDLVFGGRGMCAETPDFDPNHPTPGYSGWNITLPTLNLRR